MVSEVVTVSLVRTKPTATANDNADLCPHDAGARAHGTRANSNNASRPGSAPTLTYEEQLATQRERARILLQFCAAPHLILARIEYEDMPPRVSIVGHAISSAMLEVWRDQGAAVAVIETVTRDA